MSRQCVCKTDFTNLAWFIFVFLRIWFFFCNYRSVSPDRLSSIGCLKLLWIELFPVMLCVLKALFEWLSTLIWLFGALHKAGGSSHCHFSVSGLHHLFFNGSSCWVPHTCGVLHVQFIWPLPVFPLRHPKLFTDFIKALVVWLRSYIFTQINSLKALQQLILFIDPATLIAIRGDVNSEQAPG